MIFPSPDHAAGFPVDSSSLPWLRAVMVGAVLLAGCAAQIELQTDYNPRVDFDALETFAWLDSDISYTGGRDPQAEARVREIIRSTLTQRLESKGYRLVTDEQPDFFVSYHVVVTEFEDPKIYKDKVVILDASNPLSADRLTIYREDLRIGEGLIRKGTLLVFFVDPLTKRLIWQGLAEGTAVTPQEGQRKARVAVERLMELFPPPGAAEHS